jgi:hypothetical protein
MRPLIALALLSGAALFACSITDDDLGSQEADHTEGDPTFAQHEWLWANDTFDEFKTNAEASAREQWWDPEAVEFLPLDHPMAQRLQFWVDRLDDAFRSRFPDKLKATPKPKIVIRKSATPNAWVSSLPVAWPVKTRVAGEADAGAATDAASPDPVGPPEAADGGAAGDAAVADAAVAADAGANLPPVGPPPPASELFLVSYGSVYTSWGAPVFAREVNSDKLATFVKFHNDNFAKCRLESTGEGIIFNELCAPTANAGLDNRRGDRLAYYATSSFVTFTSSYLMNLLDEDQIISTLAHELGHYYRSHVNMPTDVVNYFYALDDAHAHKPGPDPRYLEQTTAARQKIRDGVQDWASENALMKDHRLGFYTTEQEADEISLELLAYIGVPPSVAIDQTMNSLKMIGGLGGEPDPNALKWADCAMLRDQGWRDFDGKVAYVPVGDPSDAHHNQCFRAFNLAREMAAHRYKLGEKPTPPGEPWSRLIARLGVEVDPPAPPPPPPQPPVQEAEAGAPIVDAGAD